MNFILSFQVVFPICCFMVLGYFLKRWLKLSESVVKELNQLVFKVFLPLMLFKNIYTADLAHEFNLKLLIFSIGSVLVLFLILCVMLPLVVKNKQDCATIIQGIYRSNYVLFGIPVVMSIYDANHLGMTSVLAATVIPLFNILAVILFEVFKGDQIQWGNALKGIVKNPLILASAIAMVFLAAGIPIADPLMKVVDDLAGVASPMSLLVLGAAFQIPSLGKNKNYLTGVMVGKLILVPLIFGGIGIMMGFRQSDLAALIVMLASPTAVASFTMAEQMGGNGELAGQIVALTSLFSVFTIFAWVFALYTFQLL